jgi:hypothetical protein
MLSALKRDLKKLVAELRFVKLFRELTNTVLSSNRPVYDQAVALRAQYQDLE